MRRVQLILAASALAFPAVALAAAPKTFGDLAQLIVSLMNGFTALLVLAGIVIYFYGVSTNILKFGEGDHSKIKNYFFWGIIVLFVMVSVWGILQILQNTLFPTSGGGGGGVQIRTVQNQGSSFQSPDFGN